MKTYCIYKHTNKINGKIYIGQTCQKPEYRWNNGEGYRQCPRFYKAIQKYGWDNFLHEIIVNGLDADEANQQEIYWIKFYNTTDTNYGYNLSAGGLNRNISDETKERLTEKLYERWQDDEYRHHMSEVMKQKWQDPTYRAAQDAARLNKPHNISDEGRKKISQARKEYIAIHGTPTQGIGHSAEAKEKIRQAKLGSNNPMYGKTTSNKQKQIAKEVNSKKVQCVETGEIFSSRQDAANWCGLKSSSSIIEFLNGRKKSAGKHPITKQSLHWKNVD